MEAFSLKIIPWFIRGIIQFSVQKNLSDTHSRFNYYLQLLIIIHGCIFEVNSVVCIGKGWFAYPVWTRCIGLSRRELVSFIAPIHVWCISFIYSIPKESIDCYILWAIFSNGFRIIIANNDDFIFKMRKNNIFSAISKN